MSLQNVISALRYCTEPSHLLKLECRLNEIGLTIQQSQAGKLFLCKIEKGQPACSEIFEDHVPICDFNGTLNERAKILTLEFIINNATSPQEIASNDQKGNYGLYGSTLHDGMIQAISEWIE